MTRLELASRPPTPLGESLGRLDSLVSRYVGVVREIDELLATPDDILVPSVVCETGHCTQLVGAGAEHRGAGAGPTVAAARAAALGEAVERYSACYTDCADSVLATARELGSAAVDPGRFALFAAEQHDDPAFPYDRFTADTTVAWVRGWSLPDGEPVYLPAQLVYLAWPTRPGEARIAVATSSGLACHATLEEAALTGLLELMERDAFMITWAARLSLPILSWADDSRLGEYARQCLQPTGLEIAAIDLSSIWDVPIVLGAARSKAPGEAPVGFGAAAAATVERAAEKALDEAVRVRSWARSIRQADPDGALVLPAEEICDFDEHVRFYAYDDNAGRASFLDASGERRDVTNVEPVEGDSAREVIAGLCDRLERQNASAYLVEVTAPDIADAGLHVVRVVAPELCPLDVEHAARLAGGRRLYETPVRLGLRERRLRYEDLNADPHPFP